jgi:O-acetyl-ADP-ribose deacetylase (regulator of RNase III)
VLDVRVASLESYEGEALARPVTAEFRPTTSLMERLDAAVGDSLARELRTREPQAVGSAVVTGPGSLRVGLLVHAVVQEGREPPTRKNVARATLSALHRADAWEIDHLALPPFGLGEGNFDIETSADIMVEVITSFMETGRRPRNVTILTESDEEAEAFVARMMRASN